MKFISVTILLVLLVPACERIEQSPQPDVTELLHVIDVHVATIRLTEERWVRVVVEVDGQETEDFASARFDRDFVVAIKRIEDANKVRIALGDGGSTISGIVDGDPFSGPSCEFWTTPVLDGTGRCTVIQARSKAGKRSRVLVVATPVEP